MLDSNWDAGQGVYLVIVVGAISGISFHLIRAFRTVNQKPWAKFYVGIYTNLPSTIE